MTNPFHTFREHDHAIEGILAAETRKEAQNVLDWIIEHRDHKTNYETSTR